MAVAVTDIINEDVIALEQLPGPIPPLDFPTTDLATETCGTFDIFSIYYWNNFGDKSKCFDYGGFVSAREIEDNIGADASIVPTLMDNIPTRDHGDSNKINLGQNLLRFRDLKYLIDIKNSSNVPARTQKFYTST